MGRYLRPIDQPYVSLFTPDNLAFLEQKTMERQQRHDATNAMYNQYVQQQLDKGYVDPNARNKYEAEQQQLFDDVITKYGTNLSSGANAMVGAVTRDKSNPYHALNKFQVEQAALEQAQMAQFGEDAINLSHVGSKSLLDQQGNYIQNFDRLKANVAKASDYDRIAKESLQFLQNNSSQTDLQKMGVGWLKTTKISSLSKNQLKQLATNPAVINYFKNSAPTYAYDNRPAVGYDPESGSNIFSSDQGISDFIYGANLSRVNYQESKQFMQDPEYVMAMKAQAKKEAEKSAVDFRYKPFVTNKESYDDTKELFERATADRYQPKQQTVMIGGKEVSVSDASPDILQFRNVRIDQAKNEISKKYPEINQIALELNLPEEEVTKMYGNYLLNSDKQVSKLFELHGLNATEHASSLLSLQPSNYEGKIKKVKGGGPGLWSKLTMGNYKYTEGSDATLGDLKQDVNTQKGSSSSIGVDPNGNAWFSTAGNDTYVVDKTAFDDATKEALNKYQKLQESFSTLKDDESYVFEGEEKYNPDLGMTTFNVYIPEKASNMYDTNSKNFRTNRRYKVAAVGVKTDKGIQYIPTDTDLYVPFSEVKKHLEQEVGAQLSKKYKYKEVEVED